MTSDKTSAAHKAAEAEKVAARHFRVMCPLNLRMGPSMETTVLAVLQEREVVDLIADFRLDGWANVHTCHGDGFCMTAYLQEVI